MALRERNTFFDPTQTDGFNSRDIPTEQTMVDFLDSIPFIKEPIDRSQLTRAGIAKTTTNERVRTRDNADAGGVSPTGFTTFVQPKQLPLLLSTDNSVIITEVGRVNTDDGTGDVTDYDLSVNFPALPPLPETTDDVGLVKDYELWGFETGFPLCNPSFGSTQEQLLSNAGLTALLDEFRNKMEELATALEIVKDAQCENQVAVGDVIMTVIPPVEWTDAWLEPRGQLIAVVDYPALFALIGNTYGGAAPNFALPDLTNDYYLRSKRTTAGVINSFGGSNAFTLAEQNIPLHTHTFSGTTNTDGAHSHTLPTRSSNGSADSIRTGDAANDSFNLAPGGTHNHSFNGTTDAYGQNPPDPITIEPRYAGVYLKMRVK